MSRAPAKPARPAVPLALHALLVCIVTEQAVMRLRPSLLLALLMAAAILVIAVVLFFRFSAWAMSGSVAACCVVGAVALLTSGFAAAVADAGTAELSHTSLSRFECEVVSDALQTQTGYRVRCRVRNGERTIGEAYLVNGEPLDRGTSIRCIGRFAAPADDGWGASLKAEGLLGSIRAVRIIGKTEPKGLVKALGEVRGHALGTIGPEASDEDALIAALSLGWRCDFNSRGLADLFAICGLSHVAAVSGTHVSVICAVLGYCLTKTRASPRMRVAALIVLTACFVILAGASASSVRAWIMLVAALGAELAKRRSHALSALSLTGLTMALIHPGISGNIGFLLSVCCVGGLCLFGSYGAYAFETILCRVRLPVRVPAQARLWFASALMDLSRGLGTSCVAALVALPITASAFGRLSLVGPFANALLSIPFAALVGLSAASAALSWLPIPYTPILSCARLLARVLLSLVRMLAHVPGASFSLELDGAVALATVAAAAIVLYLTWPDIDAKKLTRVCLALVSVAALVFVRWRFFAPARICVLDVGQGDAILIQEGAAAILLDTGPDGSAARELSKLNVGHLDAVVITHLHDDHYGGVADLFGQIACERVFVGEGAAENIPNALATDIQELTRAPARELSFGDVLLVGNYKLEILWPETRVSGTVNEDSLVMEVSYQSSGKELCALLTGDAEHDVIDACIHDGLLGDIDFLKVGHHGSEVSLTAQDADVLKPELAVASAGWNNSYGHPSDTCVKTLADAGAVFLCTKDVGTVIVEPGVGCVHVHETGASHEVE